MVPRGKKTIWVTDSISVSHQDRAGLLASVGFDVHFVNGPSEFTKAIEAGRPGTIMVDTHLSSAETCRVISMITNSPELTGARCVLSITRLDTDACKAAMAANFRDFLPWRMEMTQWMSRFQFAVAPRTIPQPAALGAITMNQPAILRVPGRLIWMNETHLRIECRGVFKPGTTFHVGGAVAAAMGSQHMSLTVESVHKEQLLYRYSQAIIASWSVTADVLDRARALIRRIKADSPGPRARVFIAMNRVPWRKLSVDVLNPAQYEINVAMQRSNIASEFAYFSPDVVLFDDRVANNLKDDEIIAMFSQIANDIPLVVFGPDFLAERLNRILPNRPIFSESQLTAETLRATFKKYRIVSHSTDDYEGQNTVHFMSDHPWSKVELEVSGRLRSLSPRGGSLGLPFSVGSFTLARIESPILRRALGRDVYVKMTSFLESEHAAATSQFAHESEFRLTDVDQEESKRLSSTLLQTATEYYTKHYSYAGALLAPMLPLPQRPAQTSASSAAAATVSKVDVLHVPAPLPAANVLTPQPQVPSIDEVLTLPDAKPFEDEREEKSAEKPRPLKPRKRVVADDDAPSFSLGRYVDPIIAKAIGLFLVAATLMGFVIYAAMHVDEDSYKDHGKQYGEFFKRMKDPEYRKSNPASGVRPGGETNTGTEAP